MELLGSEKMALNSSFDVLKNQNNELKSCVESKKMELNENKKSKNKKLKSSNNDCGDKHSDIDLMQKKEFFKNVIQKYGLQCNLVKNPKFNEETEECGMFVFVGSCEKHCPQRASHCIPSPSRKTKLLKFKDECIGWARRQADTMF